VPALEYYSGEEQVDVRNERIAEQLVRQRLDRILGQGCGVHRIQEGRDHKRQPRDSEDGGAVRRGLLATKVEEWQQEIELQLDRDSPQGAVIRTEAEVLQELRSEDEADQLADQPEECSQTAKIEAKQGRHHDGHEYDAPKPRIDA